MKLISCLFMLFFGGFSFDVCAQKDIALPGVVVMHNSQYKTGQREYVAFANVKSTGKCIPTSSNSKGEFTLVFSDKPAGDAATIFVTKDGLEVVNAKDLEEATVVGRLNPLKVLMCKRGELEANKELYYLISDSAVQKIYETRLKALLQKQGKEYNGVIASLKKEMSRNIKNSDEALAALNEQLQSQKQQVKKLVDQFAIENLDDQSETYRLAFTAFTKGNIDEALAILDKVDLEERLKKNAEQIEKAKSAIATLGKNIESKKEQMHQDVEQALLDARMHKLKYQFDETAASYDLVIKYDSTNIDYLKEYFDFLIDIDNNQKALGILENALRIFTNNDRSKSRIRWNIITLQTTLGFAYFKTGDLAKSEEAYKESMKLQKELEKTDPGFYSRMINDHKLLIAFSYIKNKTYSKAEPLLFEILESQKRLASKNHEMFEQDIVYTESALGSFYEKDESGFDKGDSFYRAALKRINLYSKYHLEGEASLQINLGNLYKEKHDFSNAVAFYKRALDLLELRKKDNRLNWEQDVASVKTDLGDLYNDQHDYKNAENFYLQALKVYDRLVQANAHSFESYVADLKSDLAILYDNLRDYAKAESFHLESLAIYKKLAVSNPEEYTADVASTENDLGLMYQNSKNYGKAEEAFLAALEIRERLAKDDSYFSEDLAITTGNLGILYYNKKNYEKAESFYTQSLDIYEDLAKLNPDKYEFETARTKNNLALMYKEEKDFLKAENLYLQSSKTLELLALKYPVIYEKDFFNTQSELINLYQAMMDTLKNDRLKIKYRQLVTSFYYKLYKISLNTGSASSINANTWGNLSWHLLFTKNFKEAETAARLGLQADSSQIWIKTNLAHSLLFQNRYTEAEQEYIYLKDKDGGAGVPYKTTLVADLNALEKDGITHPDIKKIRAFLSQ